jgi:hypothetical protein
MASESTREGTPPPRSGHPGAELKPLEVASMGEVPTGCQWQPLSTPAMEESVRNPKECPHA